jgi:hypothetical protein
VAALKEQGFGVITEVDVKATLKNKIGVDFRPNESSGVQSSARLRGAQA